VQLNGYTPGAHWRKDYRKARQSTTVLSAAPGALQTSHSQLASDPSPRGSTVVHTGSSGLFAPPINMHCEVLTTDFHSGTVTLPLSVALGKHPVAAGGLCRSKRPCATADIPAMAATAVSKIAYFISLRTQHNLSSRKAGGSLPCVSFSLSLPTCSLHGCGSHVCNSSDHTAATC
jgi:hypothetical protein